MPRNPRPDVPAQLQPLIDSFELFLNADKSPNTVRIYTDGVRWLGGWLATNTAATRWDQVTHTDVQQFFVYMREAGYSLGYRNNQGRNLQAFFRWLAVEERIPNPFSGNLKVPAAAKLGSSPPAVLEVEQIRALLVDAEKGRTFADVRDASILRLFGSTGCRLAELAGLAVDDLNLKGREATVTGKGSKVRGVRMDHKAALAVDRYLRQRVHHPAAHLPNLWLGVRRTQALSAKGLYRVVKRRARRLGYPDIHPHLWRHTFAHNWLDQGGAEGDLMALMGWDSAEMLRLYGASAKAARAKRAYDRVDVMRGL